MIRAHRVEATAQDDASLISGWNIAPNVAYSVALTPGPSSCGVFLFAESGALVASAAALVGTDQPCVLIPQSGQTISMIDAELGWHLMLTTTGTESQRTIRITPAVDLPDEIHPIYGDDDLALVRATAGIDVAAHYIDDLTVSCPPGLGAGLGDVASVPMDGAAVVGQVESITWAGTPNGASEQSVVRRHVAIVPEPAVAPPAPPVVVNDTGETAADETTSGNVLTNDATGLTVTAVNGLASNVGTALAGNNGGVFVIASTGAWTFDPDGDFASLSGSETVDTSVTYHASDGTAEASATLTITVSSGAAQELWTPAEISGAIVFDALDSSRITLNGSAVTSWEDMLGNGITAAQSTPSLQPAMGTGEVVFAADYLTISGSKSAAWVKALHSTGGHVFALAKFGTTSNPDTVYALTGTVAASSAETGFAILFDDRGAEGQNEASYAMVSRGVSGQAVAFVREQNKISPNVSCLYSVALDPDNATAAIRIKTRINEGADFGSNTLSHTPSTGDATHDLQIGAVGGAISLTGSIRVIAFLPEVSDADRQRMAGWAAHRHGQASLLPSDHPYKSAPPYKD